jgi:DNA-binding NarL/FixJ family response regulator
VARIRVLVVDDHRIFAESLATALAAEPDVDVSAAGSATAAQRSLERAAAENRRYDVVLVDADLVAAPRLPTPRVPDSRRPPAGRHTPQPARPGETVRTPEPARTAPPAHPAARPLQPTLHPALQPALQPAPQPPGAAAEPPADGIALVERLHAVHPATRAVVLADRDDPRRAARALQCGATGWVAKDSSLSRLLVVIRGVLRDETHLPPALLTGVLRELTAARRHRTESERLVESLTPREREVLRCMVAGLGRKAVAERLYLSPHTVRTHMQNVLGKLGVHSTLAAVALARRAGVGPADLAVPAGTATQG